MISRHRANALHVPLGDGTVNCVVTSRAMIQTLALLVHLIAARDVLVRETETTSLPIFVEIGEAREARLLRSMFSAVALKVAEAQDHLGVALLDAQKWQDAAKDYFGARIGGLVGVEEAPAGNGRAFLQVVPAAKSASEQTDRGFVYHLDADTCVVARRHSSLAAVRLGLLDPDVTLTVDQPCDVGEILGSHGEDYVTTESPRKEVGI